MASPLTEDIGLRFRKGSILYIVRTQVELSTHATEYVERSRVLGELCIKAFFIIGEPGSGYCSALPALEIDLHCVVAILGFLDLP